MKKTFRNIRTLAALLMAGAAFTACSSDDNISEQPANPAGEKVYTLTVNATKDVSATTRALEFSGEKLVAKWKTSDEIYVIKLPSSPLGPLTPTNISADGQKATFTGTITTSGLNVGDNLILSYHFHDISAFKNQNGMLNGNALYSAEAYDQAEATVEVASIDGSNITTTADASFTTQTAMIKFTLQDNAATPNKINATSLNVKATITLPAPLSTTITEDLFTFTIAPEAYTYNGNGILYYALPSAATLAGPIATKLKADPYNLTTITESDVVTLLGSAKVTFTASDGVNTYTVDKTGYPFAAGSYYTSALTMTKFKTLSSLTSSEVGWRLGNDGNAYEPTGTLPTGVTAEAVIAYVGSVPNYFSHFIAIALEDAATTSTGFLWAEALGKVGDFAAAHPITIGSTTYNTSTTGSTYYDQVQGNKSVSSATATAAQTGWRLPSITDWRYIFEGFGGPMVSAQAGVNGGSEMYYGNGEALYNAINTACGNTALSRYNYWTSSEYVGDSNWVWYYGFHDGVTDIFKKDVGIYVRAVFAY